MSSSDPPKSSLGKHPKSNFVKIGLNAFSVLGGDVLNKAGIFFVYALISRKAGEELDEFGQLSLGLLLLYTFHVFAVAGLPIALTRQVARKRRAAKRLLWHGYLACVLPATLSALLMVALAFGLRYERQTLQVIALLALAVAPYALTMITESVIKGREKMQLITLGNIPGNLFLVIGSFVALARGYNVVTVAWIVVLSRVITLVTMHLLFYVNASDCKVRRINPQLSWRMLKDSMVFLGTDGIQAIGASLTGLLLSKFAAQPARELALLGASFQLLQPIQMFYRSVGHSAFPQLVAAAKHSSASVGTMARSILGLILRLAFPAALGLFCLASDLLVWVYGNAEFHQGAFVLQILAFTLLLDPMNPILGHGLWATGHDKTVFHIVLVNVASNAIISVLLISNFGLLGAAYSALLASLINMLQHYFYFARKVDAIHLGRELISIAPPSLLAIACVALLPINLPINRFVALGIAISVYAIATLLKLEPFTARPVPQDSST